MTDCQAAVPFEQRSILPVTDLPKGVTLLETIHGFQLMLSGRSCAAFFLVPFTLVWAGGSLGGIYGMQIKKGEFNLMMSLFGLPFLAGSIFLIGLTAMAVAGRCIVEVVAGQLRIRTGAFGLYRTRTAPWSEITSCRLVESSRRGRNSYATSYQVELAVENGKPLVIGMGAERSTMLWLSRYLAGRIRLGR